MSGAGAAGPGTVRVPAAVNAHSHAFHRLLRGRTQTGRGSFWTWREQMYDAAARLDPEGYERLATAVYAEMVVTGFSAVGEFHYLHHRPDGTRYPGHEMELALGRAAVAAGIRLRLLDTCYLNGGLDPATGATVPLNPAQLRFADADADAWLARLESLRAAIKAEFPPESVQVGAALHSIRAVPPAALAMVAAGVDMSIPLHVHLAEQPAETEACVAAYGLTPTALLARHGLLTNRLSAVHATHLSDPDIGLLGDAGATIVMCPTTEADLADGIGPAVELARHGAIIALGTDQHGVVDPWLEMRGLEYGERLRSGIRGRFTPEELLAAASAGGRRSLDLPAAAEDYVLVRTGSLRTVGADPAQLPLVATAADVAEVVIGGRVMARNGIHEALGDPADLLAAALAGLTAGAA